MANAFEMPNFSDSDLPDTISAEQIARNRFTEGTLHRHKQEGLELAVRARWVALAVVAVLLPILNPDWTMLYYEALLLVSAGIGWLQRRVGRVGRSQAELGVMALDLAVFIFALVFPNPFLVTDWPTAMFYRFENFSFLFIFLALGTLSYSWRTVVAMGTWTISMWMIAFGLVWWFGKTNEHLGQAAKDAFGHDTDLLGILDPNALQFDVRLQQIVIFGLVAGILAVSIRRFNRLLLGNASLERERENLSRYFSPNVVEELSQNDDPFKKIRAHDVAAVFVDIQGFTTYASTRDPEEVIETLRSFHGLMERAIFAQNGTLDKYLGDGLMATFGTPFPAADDVRRAYHCCCRMSDLADSWNAARLGAGQQPLPVSVGLHYGPVVLGDIGGARLEFAVIGNTVNVASRLEALTRPLNARLVISEAVYQALPQEETADLVKVTDQIIRGVEGTVSVWTLPRHGT